jgi:hypothetical protein
MNEVVVNLPVSASILWGIWGILVLIFICVSWMLVHHWGYYGIRENRKVFVKSIYFIGGIGILLLGALLLGAFSIL